VDAIMEFKIALRLKPGFDKAAENLRMTYREAGLNNNNQRQ